ncbi:hypothetical protein C2S52_020067 [Perilla frutescens var. hirtella]|nr:hypothetical protein C2S52_020067 [Perilla frutescens var. hirtella]
MKVDDGSWDEDIVRNKFTNGAAESIVAISLPHHKGPDRCIWMRTKNEICYVRSGYYIRCMPDPGFSSCIFDVFSGRLSDMAVAIEIALKMHNEFMDQLQRKRQENRALTIGPWQKPDEDYWKINVDAALQLAGVGLGVVIRDSTGKLIIFRCRKVNVRCSTDANEGLVCQESILLAKEYGGRKIIVEMDCHIIIQQVNSEREDLSYKAVIINSIRKEVSHFEDVRYSWAR